MVRLIVAIALVMVIFARPVQAFKCGSLQETLEEVLTVRKLAYLSTSTDSKGNVFMFFVNPRNGNWLQLGVTEDLKACIIFEGTDWEFAFEKGA